MPVSDLVRRPSQTLTGLIALSLMASPAWSQDNVIDGLDIKMKEIQSLRSFGREGTFPNGRNGLAFSTECCNVGTVDINWKAPMNPDHPFISFMLVREVDGKFEQISDRSFVKHGFASINTFGCAGDCTATDPTILGINCSDTYSAENNSDRFWLGPADEIDPWLGEWDPVCSHFDMGEPPVPPPADCDGRRSLNDQMIQDMGPVLHRIEVNDEDLMHPDATYWFYGTYIVAGEAEELRTNNSLSRRFIPSWNGNRWTFELPDDDSLRGSILRRWAESNLSSSTNGGDDGRVYVGSKVTGPDQHGMYHYQYIIHNRDNHRGVGSLSIPFCTGATIENISFRDIDDDPTNDWIVDLGENEITFSTDNNPALWNTLYNISFDSDVPPLRNVATTMSQFHDGLGNDELQVKVRAPMGPSPTSYLGYAKAAYDGLAPDFQICGGLGTGDSAELTVRYGAPNTCIVLLVGSVEGAFDYKGGTLVPIPCLDSFAFMTDEHGTVREPVTGPGGGLTFYGQCVVPNPNASWEVTLSNALEIIIDP